MKWTADRSCYKTAARPLKKHSTRRIKHLAAGFVPVLPLDKPRDRRAVEEGRRGGRAASPPDSTELAGGSARPDFSPLPPARLPRPQTTIPL